jgi:hypothetical protein
MNEPHVWAVEDERDPQYVGFPGALATITRGFSQRVTLIGYFCTWVERPQRVAGNVYHFQHIKTRVYTAQVISHGRNLTPKLNYQWEVTIKSRTYSGMIL